MSKKVIKKLLIIILFILLGFTLYFGLIYPRIRSCIGCSQTKCSRKFNCKECIDGVQACSVMSEDESTVEQIDCPCEE